MKKYTFIRQNDPSDAILVVSESSIESCPVAETYDEYGQKCGHSDAGDYITLDSQEAADEANRLCNENNETEEFETIYNEGDSISAYDDHEIFAALMGRDDVTLEQEEIKCITYHDGHNFRTFALEGDGQDGEIIDDPETIAELETAIEEMDFIEETHGIRKYETEKYSIHQSNWQGYFEIYSILDKSYIPEF